MAHAACQRQKKTAIYRGDSGDTTDNSYLNQLSQNHIIGCKKSGEDRLSTVRHKVFISYHHADQTEVEAFIRIFSDQRHVFIVRALGTEMDPTIINSNDTDYVMRRIRELYLQDSTVTVVLIGKCTWARKYVDWEVQSSLRHGQTVTPNGLLGITLPSVANSRALTPPDRLKQNLKGNNYADGYARLYKYPTRKDTLAGWIDAAFRARTARAHLIQNPRERHINNRQCS